ncbi:SH3 domain-containing protein [Pseudomonas cuatrocienegasensis]|uniref:SH3 domain-containing protein n=2 Tax=Pseudomonas TaxID=286 RepID=A0ABY1BMT9_9PSED|nr:SH3 domain-containing protein [Pseudomonas cuatrocienegasensis]
MPAAYVRIVSRDNVNLRSAAGMKSEVITQLPKGLAVAVVSRDDRDWLEVSFNRDGYVIEGWVSRKYLTRVR